SAFLSGGPAGPRPAAGDPAPVRSVSVRSVTEAVELLAETGLFGDGEQRVPGQGALAQLAELLGGEAEVLQERRVAAGFALRDLPDQRLEQGAEPVLPDGGDVRARLFLRVEPDDREPV